MMGRACYLRLLQSPAQLASCQIMEPPAKRACPSGEESRGMMKVMVTGGTGLVGKALEEAVATDPRPNEEWVFLSFKDGDLR